VTPEERESLFDSDDPFSIVNLVPPRWSRAIKALPDKYFFMAESDLRREACYINGPNEERRYDKDALRVLNLLRIGFWNEYNRALACKERISIEAVMQGVTYTDFLYRIVLASKPKLAYIVRPPMDLVKMQEEALHESIRMLRNIISDYSKEETLFITTTSMGKPDKSGKRQEKVTKKLNTQAVAELRKITETLSTRVQGAIIQKVAIAAQQVPAPQALAPAQVSGTEPDDIAQLEEANKQLARINRTLEKVQTHGEEIIDAEVSEETP
jgi:hypothetical protein